MRNKDTTRGPDDRQRRDQRKDTGPATRHEVLHGGLPPYDKNCFGELSGDGIAWACVDSAQESGLPYYQVTLVSRQRKDKLNPRLAGCSRAPPPVDCKSSGESLEPPRARTNVVNDLGWGRRAGNSQGTSRTQLENVTRAMGLLLGYASRDRDPGRVMLLWAHFTF